MQRPQASHAFDKEGFGCFEIRKFRIYISENESRKSEEKCDSLVEYQVFGEVAQREKIVTSVSENDQNRREKAQRGERSQPLFTILFTAQIDSLTGNFGQHIRTAARSVCSLRALCLRKVTESDLPAPRLGTVL